MTTILDTIVEHKRREIAERRERTPESELEDRLPDAPPIRDFRAALQQPDEVMLLAEVKKASPSAGVIREDFHPVAIAMTYEQHGAAAISVLTDENFFQGSLSFLQQIRDEVKIPLLRKDFILDRYQLLEARLAGADAVLLIAEILTQPELTELLSETHRLDMQALVEFYKPENVQRVVDSGAGVIGINNRDLRTFETNLEHTTKLVQRIPPECCLVSESGISTREDVEILQKAGVNAVLVGETLMRSENIGAKVDELLGRV